MVKIRGIESSLLTEAVLIWTGWGHNIMPCRDDSVLIKHFGAEQATKLLAVIKTLESDFYLSDARFIADDLQEMEKLSSEQFREKYPSVSNDIVKAFAWCYSFDFK